MTPLLFPTQEVGSLRKPLWLVEGLRGQTLSRAAKEELRRWTRALPTVFQEGDLAGLSPESPVSRDPQRLRDRGALFLLRYLEAAGLDRVYDGEARRVEMYEYPIRQMEGFRFLGHVRSFDNKYYLKAASVGPVGLKAPYHVDEFRFVKEHAHRPVKVPVTGAYTLADWSWNEHYLKRRPGWRGPRVRRAAQRDLVVALARDALRPTLKALTDAGADLLQIDEPAGGTHPGETDLLVEAFNESTRGLPGRFVMHVCYSDYRSLFPGLLEARRCSQFLLEFANRDSPEHPGFEDLKLFAEHNDGREVGVGVLDVHQDRVETAPEVEDRLLRAARILKDPTKVYANPDCGLRTRSLDVAWAKLGALVEGARRARKALA